MEKITIFFAVPGTQGLPATSLFKKHMAWAVPIGQRFFLKLPNSSFAS